MVPSQSFTIDWRSTFATRPRHATIPLKPMFLCVGMVYYNRSARASTKPPLHLRTADLVTQPPSFGLQTSSRSPRPSVPPCWCRYL